MNNLKATLHVCVPHGYYIGQVKGYGCRRWRTVTGKCRISNNALSKAIRNMSHNNDTRARVLFVDTSGWYDPNIIAEAKLCT